MKFTEKEALAIIKDIAIRGEIIKDRGAVGIIIGNMDDLVIWFSNWEKTRGSMFPLTRTQAKELSENITKVLEMKHDNHSN